MNSLAGVSPAGDILIVFCASYLPYILVVMVLVFGFRHASRTVDRLRTVAIIFAGALVARFGVGEAIRLFYHRPRPFSVMQVRQLLTSNEWSFPSGHALFFFALATTLYMYNKRWGRGFFVAAVVMGAARVMAGVHYPLDILGGAMLGAATGYLVYLFAERAR